MILKSKIKEVFSDELLKLIASICDTRRIDSTQEKMTITQQLLKSHNIRFDVLGGATNRLSLYISGMVYKIAMDRQGYKDNLMEYALSKELQPYVTKTFETNGYIAIAETVRVMTREEWKLRRLDILKILDILGREYLLGDVGYINKNFTNWGIRDDGESVILDYAYVHRGTAQLFLCDVCGDGMLTYDATFSELRCTNVVGSCGVKYTYIERKMIEGDKVDYDMIDDVRDNQSIKLPKGVSFKKVKIDDTDETGMLIDGNTVVIRSPEEHQRWEMEVSKMTRNLDKTSMLDLMIRINRTKDPEEKKRLQKRFDALYEESKPEELKDVEVKIVYETEPVVEEHVSVHEELEDEEFTPGEFKSDPHMSISDLLLMARKATCGVEVDINPEDDDYGITVGGDREFHLEREVDLGEDNVYDDDDGIDLPCLMDGYVGTEEGDDETINVESVEYEQPDEIQEQDASELCIEPDDTNDEPVASDAVLEEDDDSEEESEVIAPEPMTEEEANAFVDELERHLNGEGDNNTDEPAITIDGKPLHEVV